MTGVRATEVTWNPERTLATIEVPLGDGTFTCQYSWSDPIAADEHIGDAVRAAIASAARFRRDGNESAIRRYRTYYGALYVGRIHGPPRWRFPRLGFKRRRGYVEFMAGWRFTAHIVGFSTNERAERPRTP